MMADAVAIVFCAGASHTPRAPGEEQQAQHDGAERRQKHLKL
jgi:hypothetical protein